jgi:hypothetical protein
MKVTDYHNKIKQFDKFMVYFRPKILWSLRTECVQYIGKLFLCEALWISDFGPYEGQWVFRLYENDIPLKAGWFPEEDLIMEE